MKAWADFNPRAILQLLAGRGIDFVIIGGYAAVIHGSPRVTQDLDICFATEQANLSALGRALVDMHARLFGVKDEVPFVPDERTLKGVELLTLQTDHGKLDLMTHPDGAPSYERMRAHADSFDVGGVVVRVAAIPDLISMKNAAGRAKDLGDVEELEAISRLRTERSTR
jgi:predicted nucleotidyltransferase